MLRAVLIGAVLWVAGALAAWGLCAHAGHQDDAAGRGDPDPCGCTLLCEDECWAGEDDPDEFSPAGGWP